MVQLGKTVLLGKRVMLDHLGQADLLAEGDQALQDLPGSTGWQEELGLLGQRALKVLLDFLGQPALMDPQVSLVPSPMAAETFCVQPSALLVLPVLLGCLASRVTQDTKETRASLGRMERRVHRGLLALQESQEPWVCRAHVV